MNDIVDIINNRIRSALSRYRSLVEIVTDLVFDDDGVAEGKGAGDSEIETAVGWHFGFYSRPKDGARGVVIKADGQGNTAFLVAFRDKQYELSLQKGECGMKNAFDASILLNKDGEVVLGSSANGAIRIDKNGDIVLDASKIYIGGDSGSLVPLQNGVVLASGIDSLTGSTYASLNSASSVVMAKKS